MNLWECVDGWDGWARLLRSAHVDRRSNATLDAWWDEQYARRHGGFDRLLRGANRVVAFDPDEPAELVVHELSTVRPGTAADYLELVVDELVPALRGHGHELLGAFEVLLGDTEVVTMWATDVTAHVDLGRGAEQVSRPSTPTTPIGAEAGCAP